MVRSLLSRLREWWSVEESEDRFEGSGETILDPAYNEQYEAEKELRRLSQAGADDENDGN